MSSNPLIVEMQNERKRWATSTMVYGTVNVVTRIFLILASSIVAAEKTLSDSSAFFVKAVPILALAVTVVTAFDSWLKPRDKWRGFMEDRDDLDDLLIQSQKSESLLGEGFDKVREEFGKLRERHRNKNVY